MGWWEAPENKNIIIGDTVLDIARHFLKKFSAEYREDMSRKPTVEELQYVLNLCFRVNVDDEILADFEAQEIKQVIIKTTKRAKGQKVLPGDIFCFKLDDGQFGFGRVISKVSIGTAVEIFDFFSSQPVFNYSKPDTRLFDPIIIDSYSLFERKAEGDWRIIRHTPDYKPGKDLEKFRFVYGNRGDMKAVSIINDIDMPISDQKAKSLPRYSPRGDYDVLKLIKDKLEK